MNSSSGTSSRATWSLILGILGFLCCQLCAPIAWYLGSQERAAIRAGQSASEGEGIATAGMILGIVGTVILALGFLSALVWMIFAGGIAVLGNLS